MTYTTGKQFRFEAAHHLPSHEGKCRNVHGHSYLVEVTLDGPQLQTEGSSAGMLMDFGDLSAAMKTIIDTFDHSDLNTVDLDSNLPPTAEIIANFVFRHLEPVLAAWNRPVQHVWLREVRVWETDTCWAAYSEE